MCHTCVLAELQIPAANDQFWKENQVTLAKKTSLMGLCMLTRSSDQAAVSSKVFCDQKRNERFGRDFSSLSLDSTY
jgi:hypothetical protein